MQSIVCGHDFISIPRYGSFFVENPSFEASPKKKQHQQTYKMKENHGNSGCRSILIIYSHCRVASFGTMENHSIPLGKLWCSSFQFFKWPLKLGFHPPKTKLGGKLMYINWMLVLPICRNIPSGHQTWQ